MLARLEEFRAKLLDCNSESDIETVCLKELDYLRSVLELKTIFSEQGYPLDVDGDARRLRNQVTHYRNLIKTLPLNEINSYSKIKRGAEVYFHKALKYFNLTDYEKRNCSDRDNQRTRKDRYNRKKFQPIPAIEKAKKLLDSQSYVSKVAGLYLLTGRRHGEILISGLFETPKQENFENCVVRNWIQNDDVECALFSGQTKLKNKPDKPYLIPLLTSLEEIQYHINWLRVNKPHKSNERPRGSKQLGLKVRKEFQDTGLIPIPGGKDDYLNPHNLRSAYAAIWWFRYENSESNLTYLDELLFIKHLMGHREELDSSAKAYLDYKL